MTIDEFLFPCVLIDMETRRDEDELTVARRMIKTNITKRHELLNNNFCCSNLQNEHCRVASHRCDIGDKQTRAHTHKRTHIFLLSSSSFFDVILGHDQCLSTPNGTDRDLWSPRAPSIRRGNVQKIEFRWKGDFPGNRTRRNNDEDNGLSRCRSDVQFDDSWSHVFISASSSLTTVDCVRFVYSVVVLFDLFVDLRFRSIVSSFFFFFFFFFSLVSSLFFSLGFFLSKMTNSKKEINVACNYLLRLIKAHVELSAEQIQLFKRVFFDTLSKRFVGHWFPGTTARVERRNTSRYFSHSTSWKCIPMFANETLERSGLKIDCWTFVSATSSLFTRDLHHVDR